jgi:hypothetical protein
MFDFLRPTYVITSYNNYNSAYEFLCVFNRHFVNKLEVATHFYFEFTAKRALRNYLMLLNNCGYSDDRGLFEYEVVDYRDLGYTSEDARSMARYTFG